MCLALLGCEILGAPAIRAGRMDYNEALHTTSKIETLANIVRVNNGDPITLLQVTQITPEVLGQSTFMGALMNIGANRTVGTGTTNLGLEYQMSSIGQYQPLLGQAQALQLITPITSDSLTNLYNSDWPLASLLSLTINRITPGYEDYAAAINALIALDDIGAITLSVETLNAASQAKSPVPTQNTSKSVDNETNPVLVIRLEDTRPYARNNERSIANRTEADTLWCRFLSVTTGSECVPGRIPTSVLFRTKETRIRINTKEAGLTSLATRTAFGVLSAGSEFPLFGFVSPDDYIAITHNKWNMYNFCDRTTVSFYTLTPAQEKGPTTAGSSNTLDSIVLDRMNENASQPLTAPTAIRCLMTLDDTKVRLDYEDAKKERRLLHLRRYVLIIKSVTEPKDAYVAYSDGKYWYYIDSEDSISKRNFTLVHQLLIVQAVAPTPLSAQPTISVSH